jgi:hypothetical protein
MAAKTNLSESYGLNVTLQDLKFECHAMQMYLHDSNKHKEIMWTESEPGMQKQT